MRLEVHSAADFLMNLLRVRQINQSLPENQLQHFKGSLQSLLVLRFRSHWYPDVPTKGSGYRCIRINGKMDPIVEQAGVAVGLQPVILRKMLPQELTLWIDPEEVSYRIGENGSICVLYDSQSRASPSSDIDSTGSGGSTEEFVMERVGRIDLSSIQLMDFLESSTPTKDNRANNSLGSTGSGSDDSQLRSPPLSPPFQYNNNNQRISQQQQQQNGGSPHHNANVGNNMNFMDSHLYHWEGFGQNTNNNKVRSQC